MNKSCILLLFLTSIALADEGQLSVTNNAEVVWKPDAGRKVRIHAPEMECQTLTLRKTNDRGAEASLEYAGLIYGKLATQSDKLTD